MASLLLGVKMAAKCFCSCQEWQQFAEGWFPIIKAARKILVGRMHRDDVRIALDCSTVIGHGAVLPTTLIMYPLALVISVLLPGNEMIASVSLIIVLWESAAVNLITNGNILHNIIILCIILFCCFCWGVTFMATPMTQLVGVWVICGTRPDAWDATGTPLVVIVYSIFSRIFGF